MRQLPAGDTPLLIDSHAHLDFYDDPEPILTAARAAGLSAILAIGIGDGPVTMHRALEIARSRSSPQLRLYASAGIHPQEAHQANSEALAQLVALAADPLCVAVGEIGLDYYHFDNPGIPTQITAFKAQITIALQAKKPIILHCRTSELATPQAKTRYGSADAAENIFSILESDWAPTGLPFLLHCFSGTAEQAARAVGMGGYLSFAGNLTYPKSLGIQQVAAAAPPDRILIETDSPFLAPIPLRGSQNQPANIVHTAAFLAELRKIPVEELAARTSANFQRLFSIESPEV